MPQHPHLIIPTEARPIRFTSPSSGSRERMNLPARERAEHAQNLIEKLEALAPEAEERADQQRAFGIDAGLGMYIAFESEPNFELKLESLDLAKSGIELCNVKTLPDNTMQATVFVPDGKLELFLRKITAYRDDDAPARRGTPAQPKNKDFVESLSDIKRAALEALWTEERLPFPARDQRTTWEVWLRRQRGVDHLARLRHYAGNFGLTVGDQALTFVDRIVVLVSGTADQLSASVDILGMIAEIRAPKQTAAFFTDMSAVEQRELVDDLLARMTPPAETAPFVCLLDTGVNQAHPLLMPILDLTDLDTYRPAWGVDDRHGHGTEMAGLASFGDLTDALQGRGEVACTHRIESVKIFNENDPHAPELYGAVTQECAYRAETRPNRDRVFCMSLTSTDGRDRGRPSSWSAAVDSLAAGVDGGPERLFVLAGGNTAVAGRRDYPNSNMTDGIHDPAQSWNALTVGGCTDKINIDPIAWPGWTPLAPPGDLSPCSCTSTTWARWPFKPDIVMEAGNLATDGASDPVDIEDLQLLTTAHDFATRQSLNTFADTSASVALAARYAAILRAKYPSLTPQSVRGLLVHFAEWTPAMLARFTDRRGEIDYRNLLRCYGHGTPNLARLLSSLNNSLTLVAESDLRPFFKEDGRVKTREMRRHPLPWPIDVLNDLGEAEVSMRVTLSYFVEPSPGARGWVSRYGYQSHGLRFAVRNSIETINQFEERINRAVRAEDYEPPGLQDRGWQFGRLSGLTSMGSVHSDLWKGTAAQLAERGHIAIYPTMGWWNKRPQLGAWQKVARYSLVVTIATPEIDVDLYTPVADMVGVPVVVEV
jgi:Subtilase family